MAIYFGLAIGILLLGLLKEHSTLKVSDKTYVIIAFGAMIIIAGLRDSSVGIDLNNHYADSFLNLQYFKLNEVPIYAEKLGYEWGYAYYCKLLGLICGDLQFFIFVTSLIVYGATGYFIYKNSKNVVMSTWLFIANCVFFMYMNILRQAIAVSIILVGYTIYNQSKKKILDNIIFALIILLAVSFHVSAVIGFSILLFDKLKFKRRHILIGMLSVAVLYVLYAQFYTFFLSFLDSDKDYERYLDSASVAVNFQNIMNIILTSGAFVIGCFTIACNSRRKREIRLGKREVFAEENLCMFMGLLAIAGRILVFRMNELNRVTYYFIPFLLLLYPYALMEMNSSINRKLFKSIVYAFSFFYFAYMMLKYVAVFYGTIPLVFYWQS